MAKSFRPGSRSRQSVPCRRSASATTCTSFSNLRLNHQPFRRLTSQCSIHFAGIFTERGGRLQQSIQSADVRAGTALLEGAVGAEAARQAGIWEGGGWATPLAPGNSCPGWSVGDQLAALRTRTIPQHQHQTQMHVRLTHPRFSCGQYVHLLFAPPHEPFRARVCPSCSPLGRWQQLDSVPNSVSSRRRETIW